METPIRSYCFAFTIIFARTSLSIIILGLIGNFVTILIRRAKNQKTKNKAPIFYAIRSLTVSDFIFLVLSMITLFCILQPVLLLLFLWSTLHSTCIRGSVVLILTCLKMRRLRSTTVNPVNTRRMSWFICGIVLFNGVLQFSLIFILI